MTYEELKKMAMLNAQVVISSDCKEHSFWESYPMYFEDGAYSGKPERVVLTNYCEFHPGDDVDAIINEGQPHCCRITIAPAGMGVWSDLECLIPVFKKAGVSLEELQERVRGMWEED